MDSTMVFGMLMMGYFVVVFVQSGLDKIMDWKGNLLWLTPHFNDTIFEKQVPLALGIVTFLELFTGLISLIGLLDMIIFSSIIFAFLASVLACITFLFLLFGQRMAKDYEGAKTIVIYMIPALLAVYFLT
ncbi:DoxX family protein [Flavobacterium sp. NKUCC04_CG]|uniref:DoxX family protein n=1 Tax=Flavobacterium sp. NKUCC04_CG TaxID=2842121 RepID=UPI00210279A4|nr:DoxX family protein [Flavobacterium sp. NKUCC04_CG]